MWEEFLAFLKASILPALGVIVTALVAWGVQQIEFWKKKTSARTSLKIMKENAADAVKAVDQMYPDETGENKKKLALELAQTLNKVAGLTAPSTEVQVALNESQVLTLPRKEEERKNAVKTEEAVG